ncbi:hypothetical protein [Mollivirus kamchatka]|nr:hypothetical protein [Mollivirus kamchatka]
MVLSIHLKIWWSMVRCGWLVGSGWGTTTSWLGLAWPSLSIRPIEGAAHPSVRPSRGLVVVVVVAHDTDGWLEVVTWPSWPSEGVTHPSVPKVWRSDGTDGRLGDNNNNNNFSAWPSWPSVPPTAPSIHLKVWWWWSTAWTDGWVLTTTTS